jgi:hypothetical protein
MMERDEKCPKMSTTGLGISAGIETTGMDDDIPSS